MNQGQVQRIAKSWIRLQEAEEGSNEYEDEFWSFETIDELTREKPEEAFEVILAIANLSHTDKLLGNLGAGPIEDVMLYHGPKLIDAVESEARKNPSFRRALKAVWLRQEESPIWARFSRITENDKPL